MFIKYKENETKKSFIFRNLDYIIVFVSVFLIVLTRYLYANFLLFHSIAEIFSIIIAGGIFVIGWNSRKYSNSSFFFIVGVSFLFVGTLDTIHTLSYAGMGIFTDYGSNLATSLWIAARYMQSISFLIGLIFMNKKINQNLIAITYVLITILIFILIFTELFPLCYNDELHHLTAFKITSEYIIIGILIVSITLMVKFKNFFDIVVFRLMVLSIIFTIASEFAFTLYTDVFDIQNLIGHVFKIIAFYFAYKAIIEIGLEKPFRLLFRNLAQSEIKFRLNFERAPDAIFWSNPESGHIINCNEEAELLLERSKEELIGMHYLELFPPEKSQSYVVSFENESEEKERKTREGELISKSGTIIPVLINTSMIQIGGTPIMQGIFHDITQRKSAEKKLKESEEKYRTLIESSLEGVWVIDLEGKTTLVNPSMGRILGYTTAEMMGKPLFDFIDDEYIDITRKKLEDRKKGKGEEHEFEFRHKSGKKVYTIVRATPMINDEGKIDGSMAFITDETERKKAESKLEQFFSNVSHELRTPITVLMMSIEYLMKAKKETTPEVEIRLMEGIFRNIFLLNELIEDLLLLSQIDEKKIKIKWKPFNPSSVIEENLKMMENNIKNKNLIIETAIEKDIILYGDLKRIDQVFRIFIDNAIKYSKANSKITIIAHDNYNGKYNQDGIEGVLFQFIDQGIGIRKEDISMLFERFFRAIDARDIPGTGLGLCIARDLVEMHQGAIFVESELGKGSTFFLFLPRKHPEA